MALINGVILPSLLCLVSIWSYRRGRYHESSDIFLGGCLAGGGFVWAFDNLFKLFWQDSPPQGQPSVWWSVAGFALGALMALIYVRKTTHK
jgi:hypothetical protein